VTNGGPDNLQQAHAYIYKPTEATYSEASAIRQKQSAEYSQSDEVTHSTVKRIRALYSPPRQCRSGIMHDDTIYMAYCCTMIQYNRAYTVEQRSLLYYNKDPE